MRKLMALLVAAALVLSSCGSTDVMEQSGSEPAGGAAEQPVIVEIEYSNGGSAAIELDIIRVDWADDAMLESASFLDGVDLGISGTAPAQGSIDAFIPGGGSDSLRLSFDSQEAPEGLTVTMVTSTGATLTHEYMP